MKKINKSTNKKNGEITKIPVLDLVPDKKNLCQDLVHQNKDPLMIH
jgi:hypothetical protein